MTDHETEIHGDPRGDMELVRRIAEHYRPPDPAPSARVAFRAKVDARIRRRSAGRRWALGAATAAVAAALVFWRGFAPVVEPIASDTTPEEALLALAAPADAEEETLPDDYEAIADLFLEGV